MCNMKTLSLLVRKLRPELKFFKSRPNCKVNVMRSQTMVPSDVRPKDLTDKISFGLTKV